MKTNKGKYDHAQLIAETKDTGEMPPDRNIYRPLFLFYLLIPLLLFLCSCAGGGHSRGKLSDAMEKASDRHSGDRTVRSEHEAPERYPDREDGTTESGSFSAGGCCLFFPMTLSDGESNKRKNHGHPPKKHQPTPPGYEPTSEKDPTEEKSTPERLTSATSSEQKSTRRQVRDESSSQDPPFETHIFRAETPPDTPEHRGNREQLGLTPMEKQVLNAQNDMEAEREAPPRIKHKASPQPDNDAHKQQKDAFFILGGGGGLVRGSDFEKWNHVEIGLGKYLDEHARWEIYLGGVWVPVRKTSALDQSIDNGLGGFSIGGLYKFFTTPRHTFLGQYFILGLAYSHLFWSYENPIKVDKTTIYSDNTGAFELYTGIGLHLVQYKNLQLGAEVLPGVLLWNNTTYQDFENDVLSFPFVVKFRATASFLF